jgi:oligoribonuclease
MSQQEARPETPAGPAPAVDENRLVWVDMEMSGLSPDTERVIELAMVVTDTELNVVAEGPVIAVHQDDSVLDRMDAWNR